ncbi:MAG: DUF1428 domain-containing protein [Planctomycetia bacterium]|nr:MAG: DUF1428 domain-containing protein [Planctomycetia bacterium]
MPQYVDGFVLPIQTSKVAAYRKIATAASRVWMDHGALAYVEAVGEDLDQKQMVAFPKLAGAKKGETVIFAWVVYKSRAHRDRVNAAIMKDRRILEMMSGKAMPFDCTRMAYGGFEVLVQAAARAKAKARSKAAGSSKSKAGK